MEEGLANNSNFNVEKKSSELLALIFGYFESISEERDLDKVLMLLADMGRDLVDAERCTFWMLDEANHQIYARVAHGVDKLVVEEGQGIVGNCIKYSEELIINNPYEDSRFNSNTDKETGFETREIMVIPVKNYKGKTIAAFQAINKMTGEKRFTKEDLAHMRMAASYSGKSLENAQLNHEIEQTQTEILNLLGQTCDMRSLETGDHVKRVARYSKVIAKALGLSDNEVRKLTLGSPLHDIGKIGIPDAILHKPGKLTNEEFETMKTHAEIGYNLLKDRNREILNAAAIIAYEHHEKYDGSGYPRGLKGEEIHIYGRITAVCDVFDALATERVYKKAWSLEEILAHLAEQKGKHFDPQLIELLFENLGEILRIKEKFADKII